MQPINASNNRRERRPLGRESLRRARRALTGHVLRGLCFWGCSTFRPRKWCPKPQTKQGIDGSPAREVHVQVTPSQVFESFRRRTHREALVNDRREPRIGLHHVQSPGARANCSRQQPDERGGVEEKKTSASQHPRTHDYRPERADLKPASFETPQSCGPRSIPPVHH
jgi:hypothetical protein